MPWQAHILLFLDINNALKHCVLAITADALEREKELKLVSSAFYSMGLQLMQSRSRAVTTSSRGAKKDAELFSLLL